MHKNIIHCSDNDNPNLNFEPHLLWNGLFQLHPEKNIQEVNFYPLPILNDGSSERRNRTFSENYGRPTTAMKLFRREYVPSRYVSLSGTEPLCGALIYGENAVIYGNNALIYGEKMSWSTEKISWSMEKISWSTVKISWSTEKMSWSTEKMGGWGPYRREWPIIQVQLEWRNVRKKRDWDIPSQDSRPWTSSPLRYFRNICLYILGYSSHFNRAGIRL